MDSKLHFFLHFFFRLVTLVLNDNFKSIFSFDNWFFNFFQFPSDGFHIVIALFLIDLDSPWIHTLHLALINWLGYKCLDSIYKGESNIFPLIWLHVLQANRLANRWFIWRSFRGSFHFFSWSWLLLWRWNAFLSLLSSPSTSDIGFLPIHFWISYKINSKYCK